MSRRLCFILLSLALLAIGLLGCPQDGGTKAAPDAATTAGADKAPAAADKKPVEAATAGGTLKTDKGVDAAKKIVKIGMLNDESGPGAQIGKPYALGKRILAAQINAGGSGILPDGWKVELVEKDHGYNPQKSKQTYGEVKNDVLFIGTCFGTPNTLPLLPDLEKDGMMVFSASLSSEMAQHAYTPPAGPSYAVEAMRAMDWIVETAGGADKVKAAVIYQKDDYGKDGQGGWKIAADHHKVKIVSEQTVAPGQKDMTAVITALKDAGATHVLLTTLPSATGPILGKAAQLKFKPVWIGNTPAWVDPSFSEKVIPVPLDNYFWAVGLPFWGEKVPGMDKFLEAYNKYGKDKAPKDFYVLVSYIQGLLEMEALTRAIKAGDVTRAGYKTALQGIVGWNGGGLVQPMDLTHLPYVAGTKARILKPIRDKKTWEVVAPYADPKSILAVP